MNKILTNIYQTDWLASTPVFYNKLTNEVSYKMLDVIDWANFDWDFDGLKNYLEFGYCVFERTPIKNVYFLRHSSILTQNIDINGKKTIHIQYLDDPIFKYIEKTSTLDDVMNSMIKHTEEFEKNRDKSKRLLLPLSGGYDSRFLASLIKDKASIDAYTYGLTKTKDCFELARAKEVAKRLKINHNMIKLTDFNNNDYCEKAFDQYGLQMPLHSMYHMEFYDKIKKINKDYIVVSGSVGDWFSGEKINLDIPKNSHEFNKIFFNHGISIPREFIKYINNNNGITEEYYQNYSHLINSNRKFMRIAMFRNRINLSGYIFSTASQYFPCYTPFYDIDIAFCQLNLPDNLSLNRKWQFDYFKSVNLNIESDTNLKIKNLNRLDHLVIQSSFEIEKQLLDVNKLQQFVNLERLNWINEQLAWLKNTKLISIEDFLLNIDFSNPFIPKKIHKFANRKLSKISPKLNIAIKAFNEWTVLKPIEYIINLQKK